MKKYSNPTEEAYKRYKIILDIIKGNDIAENLLDSLIEKACNYVTIVCCNEISIQIKGDRLEGKDYREFVQSLDIRRHSAHEALISSLHAFNRYCIKEYEETPVGGIYSFDPVTIRDRVAVANWAITLINSIFEHRKI